MTQLALKDDKSTEVISKNHEKKIQRKQRRFQHMITNDAGVICCDQPTKNLVICNAGLSTGLDQTALVCEFSKFGALSDVCLLRDKSYCFVICPDEFNARQIYEGIHAKSHLGQNYTVIYLTYCVEVPTKDINDKSQQCLPPGLVIIENFITPTEEETLINLIEWNQTEENSSVLKHRQVKHFGYEFRYDTNNVDADKPLVNEKIPDQCTFLWDKFREQKINDVLNEPPQQITVNKYEPGQGIPPHVDTHSAFEDAIVSLSLASDIVMEFRKPSLINAKEYVEHVSLSLPRRSLLVMSGESRYGWKHGITPRKIDVIRDTAGHLTTKFRSKRISYTFRWLSKKSECKCEFHSLCDTYQNQKSKESTTENAIENPSLCELENVHKVYNEIACHFSETRHSPWPQVNEFIQSFEKGSVLVDIGCGNGKYLQSNRDMFEIGCDRSDGLLNVCRERQFNIFQCDCLAVPIRSNSVDACISIAVIHHLASEERRRRAVGEMVRILRPMGRALIYVWAKNQAVQSKSSYLLQNKRNQRKDDDEVDETGHIEKNPEKTEHVVSNNSTASLPIHTNRTQFEHTDILVPWKLKNPSKVSNNDGPNDQHPITFLRFYHVFEENELETLCKQFENISIVKSYYDQGNWCVIFQKNSAG